MSTSDTITLVVRRIYSFSAERVFDAWLNPKLAGAFLFTTPESEIVRCEIDARVGGAYTIVDRRANGEEILHTGTYIAIERPHRLVFTLQVPQFSPDVDKIVVEITSLSTGCELVLTNEIKKSSLGQFPVQEVERGWNMILTGLGDTLASTQL